LAGLSVLTSGNGGDVVMSKLTRQLSMKTVGLTLLILALLISSIIVFAKEIGAMEIAGPGINDTTHQKG
jgi:hypothetical protein